MTGDIRVRVAGQHVYLLPERGLLWEERSMLIVADTHWGKAAAFRAAGLPVPGGTTAEGLERLDSALGRTEAKHLLFLGDFLHARQGRVAGTLDALARWRRRWSDVEMLLVRGNHDRHAGDPPPELGIQVTDGPRLVGPFAFDHHPRPVADRFLLCGHLHPAARLAGGARQRERLPCFWLRPDLCILPAFGAFTGTADVLPTPGDRLFVLAGQSVLEIEV